MTRRTPRIREERRDLRCDAQSAVREASHRIESVSTPCNLRLADEGAEGTKLPTFEMEAYSGGPIRQWWSDVELYVDLDGVTFASETLPILLQHMVYERLAHTTSVRIEGGKLSASGVMSGTSDMAKSVVEDARNGFPFEASIGGETRTIESVLDGETTNVNGREVKGPCDIIRRFELKEISFVVLGADPNTSSRVAASYAASLLHEPSAHGGSDMPFKDWVKAKGLDYDNLSNHQRDQLKAEYDAEQAQARQVAAASGGADPAPSSAPAPQSTPAPAPTPPVAAGATSDVQAAVEETRRAVAAETKRINRINAIAAEHKGVEDAGDRAEKAIEAGTDVVAFELEMVRADRGTVSAVRSTTSSRPDRAVEAALCLQNGIPAKSLEAEFGEDALHAAHGAELRGIGLHWLMGETLAAVGERMPSGRPNDQTIKAFFHATRQLEASGASTMSVTGILSNLANKKLLAQYTAGERLADRICEVTDHPDFKVMKTYRVTAGGEFKPVGPDGELKHATMSEEEYENKVDTRGLMMGVTRQQLIDDDLGAFLRIPAMFGRKARVAENRALAELILANAGSFFHADNNNYHAGSNTAFGIDSLTVAEQTLMDQVDSDGDPLDTMGKILLVPSALKTKAENHMTSDTVTTGENATKMRRNPHAGKFDVVASSFLNAQALAGSSATGWYLLASPMDIPVFQIAYLRGQRGPVIEQGEMSFEKLGIQFRAYSDFGVAKVDHRGAVFMKGAA